MKHHQLMRHMIRRAVREHGPDIKPAGNHKALHESFTVFEHKDANKLVFWFNTADGSTHIMSTDLKKEPN